MSKKEKKIKLLTRIAESLERLAPEKPQKPEFKAVPGALWESDVQSLTPLKTINHIELNLLIGINQQRDKLRINSKAFAKSRPANNALLWGARGMGKSALIKAIHHELYQQYPNLILIEIKREDLGSLNKCLDILRVEPEYRFILFCDDLSFEQGDSAYKSLKAVLEGGIAGPPENVIVYATSNQRHLLPRSQTEYEGAPLIHETDMTNERISLSDRFGLWLGFHNCTQEEYQKMISSYADHFNIKMDDKDLQQQAHQWAMQRGNRSGRVAWQFIQHIRGSKS